MKIIIESPHFTVNELLQEYVTSKVNKLVHFNERLIKAQVTLKLDRSDKEENKVCEINVLAPQTNYFASAQCSTFEEAVTATVHALEKQLKKQKGKNKGSNEKLYISGETDEV